MDYKKIGFIGTQAGMNEYQLVSFYNFIFKHQNNIKEFHYGDSVGSESQAASCVKNINNMIKIIGYPSFRIKNRGWQLNDKTYKPSTNIRRYHDILNNVDIMIICPKKAKQEIVSKHIKIIINTIKRKHTPVVIIPIDNNEFTITQHYFCISALPISKLAPSTPSTDDWCILYKCNRYLNNNCDIYVVIDRYYKTENEKILPVPYTDLLDYSPTIYTSKEFDALKGNNNVTEMSAEDFFIELL